jgi:hypothetical protein
VKNKKWRTAMSKTVIIPDLGQNPLVVTNGRECYRLYVGKSYLVPDWVAKLLEDAEANHAKGERDAAGPFFTETKTEDMTQPVGRDSDGKLWTAGRAAIARAEAASLAPGSEATVTAEQTDEGTILYFGIPCGEKGDKGDKGEKGEKGEPGEAASVELLTASELAALWDADSGENAAP